MLSLIGVPGRLVEVRVGDLVGVLWRTFLLIHQIGQVKKLNPS
jgi:hypothetical protein